MEILDSIYQAAKKHPKRVVLPESLDERILRASEIIKRKQLAEPVLLGDLDEIKKKARSLKVDLTDVEIIDSDSLTTSKELESLLDTIYKKKNKPLSQAQINKYMQDTLCLSALMVKNNQVDGCLAGSVYTTADVLKVAFSILGAKRGVRCMSSAMIMVWSDKPDKKMIFADCAVNVDPDVNQLHDIAIASAENAQKLLGIKPKVAMLSFSTHGSAEHELSNKVAEATLKLKKNNPSLIVDGELQLDAAIHPITAQKKAPNSPLKGEANVLVFPNLSAGNIGYKLVERLAGAKAIGPILQGVAYPMNDLSRGASVDDIVNMCAITSLQAQNDR